MSDPSAIIAAIVIAAGGAVSNTDLPPEVKAPVTDTVAAIEEAAPALDRQVGDVLATLPAPVQQFAQQGIDDAAQKLSGVIPPGPLTPPLPAADTSPRADSSPAGPEPSAIGDVAPGPVDADGSVGSNWASTNSTDTVFAAPTSSVLPRLTFAPGNTFATFVPWLTKAGKLCDGITAPTLAALYSVENGFRYGPSAPVSPVGAKGPGQFMDGTWRTYGKDADGDGTADILGVADSVMASGHFLCDLYTQIDAWKQRGRVRGDTLDLAIAGYNAGAGAVLASGGMPSGSPDYENQTKPYVAKIRAAEDYFARLLSPFGGSVLSEVGARAVESAMNFLGLPYVWGGGNIHGPSHGGFDCSGLTSYAVYTATAGKVTLPRTSETQWNIGVERPLSEAMPGDLLFGNWGPNGPGHVAIYVGNGQMIHAPTTGDVVRIADIFPEMKVRRIV
ncbi:C40 family peptidase (plasmid) [Rhodococcus sp. ZPP]|uniref:C40 family peptidase n=1 Tax=Rhodococcus sp. ZPP TaxID=2749906 RepID=UPI001AD89C45|nr:bifunctional lytic transglycosylase/C40 family peptidase [Rhodococcus sp. ZPP]QTJ70721.1 C40 family peptidase [Rhodococcus sp. ZPP]